jgi:predicted RNA-binding protein YlqC (UPF0109 family)
MATQNTASETLIQGIVLCPDKTPKDIPRILGKGGFNIKNLVKYSAKKWHEEHATLSPETVVERDETVRAPHVNVNLLHDEESGVHFILESSCELMVKCAKAATEELLSKLSTPRTGQTDAGKHTKRPPNTGAPNKRPFHGHNNLSERVMKQFFRIEMDPMMLGKLIGKGGSRVQDMIKFVIAKDDDKAGAKSTKIFVKEQTAPLSNDRCIDLDEFGDGSEKYVLFIATVSTNNLYKTMRNVEKAIEKNVNRSSLDVSTFTDHSAREQATAEKMFEGADSYAPQGGYDDTDW